MGSIFWTGGLIALSRLGSEPWDPTLVFAPDPSIEETKRMVGALAERGYLKKADASFMGDEAAWCFADVDERMLVEATVDPEITRRRKRFAAQWIEARAGKSMSIDQHENIAILYQEGHDPRRASHRFVAAGDEACRVRLRACAVALRPRPALARQRRFVAQDRGAAQDRRHRRAAWATATRRWPISATC
jgi:hypothetical protein